MLNKLVLLSSMQRIIENQKKTNTIRMKIKKCIPVQVKSYNYSNYY